MYATNRRPLVLALLGALAVLGAAQVAAAASTRTTTTYFYNADGAPTAITTQVGSGAPTTLYLTWDNFTPDADDPTTGTVTVGNGTLRGYGPAPGSDGLTAQFSFDRRERLIGYSGSSAVTYDHLPTGIMSTATLSSGDTRHFYYDSSAEPQVTNLYDEDSAQWSAYLGRAHYTSDGFEEVLVQPRKDVAGTYDPAQQTLSSYVYDAWGADPTAMCTDIPPVCDSPTSF